MFRKVIVLSILQISMLFSQTHIAVVEFEALGVSEIEARALTNRLIVELHRTNKFKVLERKDLDKIIEEQKFQLSGCNADQCLVELGQLANVQQIIGGSISRVGEVFTITARLISVETGTVVQSALYDYDGKIGFLMRIGMKKIAEQLAQINSGELSEAVLNPKPMTENKNNYLIDAVQSTPLDTINFFTHDIPIRDIDGNTYKTVKIGDQVWMAENLRVTHYRNGDVLLTEPNSRRWKNLSKGATSVYSNDKINSIKYGNLYNWYSVNDSRSISPIGWHVPSYEDYRKLYQFLREEYYEENPRELKSPLMEGPVGSMLKAYTFSDFPYSSGFNALPAGYRNGDSGKYEHLGMGYFFWCSTESTDIKALGVNLYEDPYFAIYPDKKGYGFSVRCVKD